VWEDFLKPRWALDLSGDGLAQPITVFKRLFRRAKEAGLRVKAHVGEWGTADDAWQAVEEAVTVRPDLSGP
jgi:adenosine deaminase